MTKIKIIAANPGGIANRLKCLISMWRLSDKYNKKLYLHWVKNKTCGAEFNRLFKNEFNFISDKEIDNLEDKILSQTSRLVPFKDEIADNFAEVHPSKRGNNIDFEFYRIPLNVRENFLEYIKKLIPIKVIGSIVKEFSERFNLKDVIGVHIRRGDFLGGKDRPGKVSPDEKFVEKMELMLIDNPSLKFFLCTDGPEVEDKFLKKFGSKIVIYPKINRDRTSLECTQDGLVDLLLLSKTKHILGTYTSTFTELAWWFGGCTAKVDIIIEEGIKIEYEKDKEMLERSKYRKFKVFVYQLLRKMRLFSK